MNEFQPASPPPLSPFAERRQWGPVPFYPKVKAYRPPAELGFITVAGPCSVESEEQIYSIAKELSLHGVRFLRGGVFRAGTYPGSDFGPKVKLMEAMYHAATENGMKVVMEVLDYTEIALGWYAKFSHCFQVGARQMQNYALLRRIGGSKRLIFLKRHPGSTLDELLGAAEHILTAKGDVVLVERGTSSHMNHVRWDLSISMIPAVKAITAMPIIVDASHGTGRRDLVEPMTLAGVAAGADGFLTEVHPDPEKSLSDADQAYPLEKYGELARRVRLIRETLGYASKESL